MVEPDHGSVDYDRLRAGLAVTRAATYAVERRRGWSEAEGSPARAPSDMWDERRAETLEMTKPQPNSDGSARLVVSGGFAAFRSGGFSSTVRYRVVDGDAVVELPDVQWADWARDGRLLVATANGNLETRGKSSWLAAGDVVANLADERPAPTEAPAGARSWAWPT